MECGKMKWREFLGERAVEKLQSDAASARGTARVRAASRLTAGWRIPENRKDDF